MCNFWDAMKYVYAGKIVQSKAAGKRLRMSSLDVVREITMPYWQTDTSIGWAAYSDDARITKAVLEASDWEVV